MARTVPSVIGISNVWPVRLSVTVSVSPPAAARSPDRCSVGVVMHAVCPRPSDSNAGGPKLSASGRSGVHPDDDAHDDHHERRTGTDDPPGRPLAVRPRGPGEADDADRDGEQGERDAEDEE